jgi:hypothetical protein
VPTSVESIDGLTTWPRRLAIWALRFDIDPENLQLQRLAGLWRASFSL